MNKPKFDTIDPLQLVNMSKHSAHFDGESIEMNEGISLQKVYTEEDTNDLEHLQDYPGVAPNSRDPYLTVYVTRTWTVRQYAGFSPAEDRNVFCRRNLAMGQKGLSAALDFATRRGYDSNHP